MTTKPPGDGVPERKRTTCSKSLSTIFYIPTNTEGESRVCVCVCVPECVCV